MLMQGNKKQQFDIIHWYSVVIQGLSLRCSYRLKVFDFASLTLQQRTRIPFTSNVAAGIVGRSKFNMWSIIYRNAKIEWSLDKISNAREALYGHELSLATV